MSLLPTVAEQLLRARLGTPINPVPYGERAGQDNKKVLGFAARNGRVLALNREAVGETHIWFEAPPPEGLDGVSLKPNPAKNANLSGQLSILNQPHGLQVEIDTETALGRFLHWYARQSVAELAPAAEFGVDQSAFRSAFARFQSLISAKDKGHTFVNFYEGLAAVWEGYKPRLRQHALAILNAKDWSRTSIGSGEILRHVIDAIEIQEDRSNLVNNLVFWQNRFGHANRDHRVLLDARSDQKLRDTLENLLYGLYRSENDDVGSTFDHLSAFVGNKYPLVAYLFFLRDMDRFTPIRPTGFDRAFRALGINFSTLHQCNWENYAAFNAILYDIARELEEVTGLKNVRLLDAHSFCWIFSTLLRHEAEGSRSKETGGVDDGRIIGGREKAMIAMRLAVENTVKNSNGQVVQRVVKNKELLMATEELERTIVALLDQQGNCCNLTGLPLNFYNLDGDKNLLPSLDRIDSNRHYEIGNLQVVCQFINFWKSDTENGEFRRLLMLVRGVEAD
jgi:hypothetical protein